MTRLHELFDCYGQSAWIDNIRRDWLNDGTLEKMVSDGVRGVTSNPSIFANALVSTSAYDQYLKEVSRADAEEVFEHLAASDVRDACDVLSGVYTNSVQEFEAGNHRFLDGFVSLEVSPLRARDTAGTISAAQRLSAQVGRPNVMIKIPATVEGLPAISQVLGSGISVNVTLIFSLARYQQVLDAWIEGLKLAVRNGHELSKIGSVASFFVSRVDAKIDDLLATDDPLRGSMANAQVAAAYEIYLANIDSSRVAALLNAGAQVQRPLWASTSPKNTSYDALLYVDSIVADETVNTMRDATLVATMERGSFTTSLLRDPVIRAESIALLSALPSSISLSEVTTTLEKEGVDNFVAAYRALLVTIETKIRPTT